MRPIASLSLDLDNEWAYLKTRGDPAWSSYPTYLPVVTPRILETLERHRLPLTVFVVGQDATIDANAASLRAFVAAGHEIGNHSMRHEPWLHLYDEAELQEEISRSEDAIAQATGVRPTVFRGPGFSMSRTTLEVLVRRGYRVDASTFPSSLGPLARAYYFARCGFDRAQRERLSRLFGSWRDGLQPLTPYRLATSAGHLIEIPVTTMPLFRVPIHLSYVMFLASKSEALAILYFRIAMTLCRMRNVEPSILLHPLDFLGGEDVPSLRFFPTMTMTADRKLRVVDRILRLLASRFEVLPVGAHAERVAQRPSISTRSWPDRPEQSAATGTTS